MLGETIPGNDKGKIVASVAGMAMGLSVRSTDGLANILSLPGETLELMLNGWSYAFGVPGMDETDMAEAARVTAAQIAAQLTAILLINKGVPEKVSDEMGDAGG